MLSDDEGFAEDILPFLFRNGFQDKMIYNTRRLTSYLIYSYNLCFSPDHIIQLGSASSLTRLGCFSKCLLRGRRSDILKDAILRWLRSGWGKDVGGWQ